MCVCVCYDSVIIIISLFLFPTGSGYIWKAIFFLFPDSSAIHHHGCRWLTVVVTAADHGPIRACKTEQKILPFTTQVHLTFPLVRWKCTSNEKKINILQKLQTTINLSIYICHVELQIVAIASTSTTVNGFFHSENIYKSWSKWNNKVVIVSSIRIKML